MSYGLSTSKQMKEPPSLSTYFSVVTLLLVEKLQFSLLVQNYPFYGFKNVCLESNLMDSLQKAE